MSANIFISFASQDRKVATILCNALETRGFECWISTRNILPGENFQVAIVQAIRRSKIMLLVFTENSNKSEEMTKELALASQQKLIVIPLRVEDVTPNEAFSYEFATRQWIDFFADWEFAMDQLSQRISNAIGASLAEEPVAAPAMSPLLAVLAKSPAAGAPPLEHEPDLLEEAARHDGARPKSTLRRMALACAIVAVAIGVSLGLGLPAKLRAKPQAEPTTAMLAVATLQPVSSISAPAVEVVAPDAVVVAEAPAEPKPVAKRKVRKAERRVEEEIPY